MLKNIDNYLASPQITLVEAMRKIDTNVKGILFIVDDERRLLGSLTDGDIRRCIIRTGDLQSHAEDAMLKQTKFFTEGTEEDPCEYMERMVIRALPIVDTAGRIVDIVFLEKEQHSLGNSLAAVPVVIMAGGQGTRLYPYTKVLPKALIPIREKTISEHIIDSFRYYGCEDFTFILNHKKNMIKAYFNELPHEYRLHYVEEELPLGTGGGVELLSGRIEDSFILTNCDILIREDMDKIYRHHRDMRNLVTMICSMKEYTLPYGVVHTGEAGSIVSMEEKPQLSFLVNTGCYIVEPEVIGRIPKGKPIGFPEVIEQLRQAGERVGVYPIGENAWMDMGEMDLLEKAMT